MFVMFVGHYEPGFAIKTADRSTFLWPAFIAVQLVDILPAIPVLLGMEKFRIVPGITAANSIDRRPSA